MRRPALVLLLSAVGMLLAGATPAAAQQGSVTERYVHGIPGTPVDVYANGRLGIRGLQPGALSDPLTPQPGPLHVDLRAAGTAADAPVITAADYELPANSNVTTTLHLTEAGEPEITRFLNDTSGLQPGQGRLTIRHAAVMPEVDVRTSGGPTLPGLSNGDEASAEVPAGAFEITIALAGEDEPIIEPVEVDVPAGSQTIVYPVGSPEEGTFDILVQTVSGDPAPPAGVPSGDGGAAAPPAMPPLLVSAVVLAAFVSLASVFGIARERH